jgi:flagellar hook-length control protein FliK
MTNLPITTSAPQTAAVSKQSSNAAESGGAQNNQPFGEVLARQIKDPTVKDAKADDKLAIDALSQLGTDIIASKKDAADIKKDAVDIKKTDPAATDNTTTLPTDMLAALLPQAMNIPAPTATPATSNAKSDSPAISANTVQDKLGIASLKTNVTTGVQTDTTAKTTTGANPDAPIKEQSFATVLAESANRAPGTMELGTASREAIAVAAAPQSNAAALAALQNTAASLAVPAMQPVQVTISTPVTQDKWADEFSQKITWLASSNKDQTAELHLNPPQLGPLDVVIKVSGDQATALFTSPHAAVRDAIEQAMPKLRDMLADNGIMLGNATVSDQQAPRDQGQSGTQRSSVSPISDIRTTAVASNSTARVSPISRHNGIVDTFA